MRAILFLGLTIIFAEKSAMTDQEQKIRRAAAEENHWSEAELEVKSFAGIELPRCRFYLVTHKTRPIHEAMTYALLPAGTVVSQSDEGALAKILAACYATRASAESWAELLVRYRWDVGPGRVHYEEE